MAVERGHLTSELAGLESEVVEPQPMVISIQPAKMSERIRSVITSEPVKLFAFLVATVGGTYLGATYLFSGTDAVTNYPVISRLGGGIIGLMIGAGGSSWVLQRVSRNTTTSW